MSLLQPFRTKPSLRRPAITVVLLFTTVLIGEQVLTAIFDGVLEGSSAFSVWLPQFGTIGQTVLYYTLILKLLQLIAIPAALVWLAYAYGRHTAN